MVSTPNPKLILMVVDLSTVLPTVNLKLDKQTLQTILQRALNTWSDVPPEVLQFSDSIDRL